ncbi:MAG TPA: HlyD family efflux transporter periplasmic adaptor subunit [Bacteroidales bacterium]|nr:HlyD family efflux transporter periplasmic adaptor subunit [Bacteroidales bacterium]
MKTIKKLPSISALVLLATSAFFTLSCGGKDGEYDASGTFEATEIIVSSEANGKILSLDIVEGQQLEAGAPVGTIDSTQLYLKKRQLLTSVRGVEVRRPEYNKQIAATQQQIATQISEKARIERLVKADAATQKQLDDINSSISVLQKQLEAQKSSLTTTTSGMSEDAAALMIQVDQLNDQLSKCRILSPIKGTVLVKYAEAGELTGSGKPLFKIADIENMILRAYITSDIITKLKLNQEVKVYADFGEKEMREYTGTIVWISDKAEFTPKTIQTKKERANLVYAVKIAVKNDGYIKIGMYGEVKI